MFADFLPTRTILILRILVCFCHLVYLSLLWKWKFVFQIPTFLDPDNVLVTLESIVGSYSKCAHIVVMLLTPLVKTRFAAPTITALTMLFHIPLRTRGSRTSLPRETWQTKGYASCSGKIFHHSNPLGNTSLSTSGYGPISSSKEYSPHLPYFGTFWWVPIPVFLSKTASCHSVEA